MNTSQLTVFFDGGCCNLCCREIAHYRQLQPLIPIEWVDVTREPQRLDSFSVRDAMAELHVMDDRHALAKGADGFLLLWGALPYYHWLARGCRILRLQPLMRWFYTRFATWHFRRRCAAGACSMLEP